MRIRGIMQFHKDSSFDAQLKRTLGHCTEGGAEISECLSMAAKIEPRDYQGWHAAWRSMADSLSQAANKSIHQKSYISAGNKLLRASNYYRTAFFFLEENPEDKRITECVKLSRDTFKKALDLLKVPSISLNIPYEGGFLPGYLFLSNHSNSRLLIDTGGGDNTMEELYFISVKSALARGYHCLIFEGPGQGGVLRIDHKPFRYDWDVVLKAVIDFIEKNHPELGSKIALKGDSFGGYLAARAAAYEKRIKACIVNPGILNPTAALNKVKSEWLRSIKFFLSPDLKFLITSRYHRFGAKSFEEMLECCKKFSLDNASLNIQCPTLIMDNEEEHITKGEAWKLYQKLQGPKEYYLFKKEQQTGGHCQPLGQANTQEIMFDWLDTLEL